MREQFVEAVKQVRGLVAQGFNATSGSRRTFELELAKLLAPHLAGLVRRRQQLLEGSGRERWSDELDTFMRRTLWPALGAERDYADRNRTFVTLLVDVMVEREQRRTASAEPILVPLVARLDAGLAS